MRLKAVRPTAMARLQMRATTSGSAWRSGWRCPPCSATTTTPARSPVSARSPPPHARAVAADQRRAQWRFAVTDTDGRLLFDGITRRRPIGLTAGGPRGGIVELHVPVTLLAELTNSAGATEPAVAPWTAVLADIGRQYAARDGRDLDAHPDDRLPRSALRRHTQIRDRSCVGVGCRHRPTRCDQDHTTAYQLGGETVAADLAPLCRHDHVLKAHGWTLQQPEPGTFLWISPLGGRYEVQPEPVLPPPPALRPGPDDPSEPGRPVVVPPQPFAE